MEGAEGGRGGGGGGGAAGARGSAYPHTVSLDVKVLKDLGEKVNVRIRTARSEFEQAMQRGDSPLQQVRAVLPVARSLAAEHLGQQGRKASSAGPRPVGLGGGVGGLGDGAFVPWRGWNEMETSIKSLQTSLKTQGEASLRGVTTALGIEVPPPGTPWAPLRSPTTAEGKGGVATTGNGHGTSAGTGGTVAPPRAHRRYPSLEDTQLGDVLHKLQDLVGEKAHLARPSRSRSGIRSIASDTDLAAAGKAAAVLEAETEAEGTFPPGKGFWRRGVKGARRKGKGDGKKASGFAMSRSLHDLQTQALEEPEAGGAVAGLDGGAPAHKKGLDKDFWRSLADQVKLNGEGAQAAMQTLLRDLQQHLDTAKAAVAENLDAARPPAPRGPGAPEGGGEETLDAAERERLSALALHGTKEQQLQASRRLGHDLQQRVLGSIRDDGNSFAIVTTASLPWMTGTAVNPLLRAAYLAQEQKRKVTLVVPFLPFCDQKKLFPGGQVFHTPAELEEFIKGWVAQRVGFTPKSNFNISFYPGRYSPRYGCVFSVGDITKYAPDSDVAVLEEPEHLNWFHHGTRWSQKFKHVVGVVHTNYLEYSRREEGGESKEAFMRNVNALLCRLHCHKVVKLSDAVQELPRSVTQFVHGVSPHFLDIGDRIHGGREAAALAAPAPAPAPARRKPWSAKRGKGKTAVATAAAPTAPTAPEQGPQFTKGVYFIGKVLWPKGYTELLSMLEAHQLSKQQQSGVAAASGKVHVDVYGGGEDLPAVQRTAAEKGLDMSFMGPKDHAHRDIHDYKVFVNPSLSDVVATTTAEALAMGKFVVVAKHPSNEFFSTFNNCLVYDSKDEFIQCMDKALNSEPVKLTAEERYSLSWEAATERFLDVAEVPERPIPAVDAAVDTLGHSLYSRFAGSEDLRSVVGFPDSRETVTGDLGHWASITTAIPDPTNPLTRV